MNNKWVQISSNFHIAESSNDYNLLPVAIYKTEINPRTLEIYLTKMEDKFSFSYKVYGIEQNFINRVAKTYESTKGNLGILLNGIKGTGKTVTAELICNKLNLPIIIVKDYYEGIADFINNIQQDVVMFFDEFEKIYKDCDHDILSVMDGVLSNEHRKVFLLTTNSRYINDNMLQRPSRIRYVKEFKDLSVEAIVEIIDDKLINKEFKDPLINFISTLEIITVDIVKSLVEEVNIHCENPVDFKEVFNVSSISNCWNVYHIEDGKPILKQEKVQIEPTRGIRVGNSFSINGIHFGYIGSIMEDDTYIINVEEEQYEDGNYVRTITKSVIVHLEKAQKFHKYFTNYAF